MLIRQAVLSVIHEISYAEGLSRSRELMLRNIRMLRRHFGVVKGGVVMRSHCTTNEHRSLRRLSPLPQKLRAAAVA